MSLVGQYQQFGDLPAAGNYAEGTLVYVKDDDAFYMVESGAWVVRSSLPAGEILTLLKTVDGASSGLDADMLDGEHADAFADASHAHTESDITNLDKYTRAQVDALITAVDTGAPAEHTHVEADITNLDKYTQAEVDSLIGGVEAQIPGTALDDLDARIGLTIVELSTGNWSGDAPARNAGENPILFVGATDPADATNGITSPANINDGDHWLDTSV